MMKCPTEGIIQGYIDKELTSIEMKEVESHIFQCANCRETYKELNSINNFTIEKFHSYQKELNIKPIKKSNLDIQANTKKGVFRDMKKYKNIAVAAGLTIVLTTFIAVKPIRAAVADAVSIFRVKDLKSVNISIDDIKKLETALSEHKADISIDKIGKVNFQDGELKSVTIDEAKSLLPFTILTPQNLSDQFTESISINESSRIDFTLNVANVNEILKSLGGENVFPKTLDGKTFSLNMAGVLNASYDDAATNKYITVTESTVPELIVPNEANVDEIFNALSELSILPPDMQDKLKSMKDWKSTLYVPNVDNQLEELSINGMKAVASFNDGYSSILILKDNVLVSINGNLNKDEILEFANSMR